MQYVQEVNLRSNVVVNYPEEIPLHVLFHTRGSQMKTHPILGNADLTARWRRMVLKPLAGDRQIKPPRLTAPRLEEPQISGIEKERLREQIDKLEE